ncbi:MAG: repeat protein [Planctomycetaceae bacterium]|nr:repeat protein [Planctomycetaceae bacterium]
MLSDAFSSCQVEKNHLETDSPQWRRDLETATQSPTSDNIAVLVTLLSDPASGEMPRQAIAEALGRTGHADASDALLRGTSDKDETLRGLCAIGLGAIHSRDSVIRLLDLLTDGSNTVRNLAERSLLQMPEAISQFGIECLIELLEHPVPLSRSPAARLLGLTQDPRGLVPLVKHLKQDKQWLVRMWAAKGLGDLGSDSAFDDLAERLQNDEKNRVRAAAAEAIGKLHHPGSEAVLTAALSDPDGGVQKHAEESLAKLRRAQIGYDEPEEHHEPHFEDE